MPWLEFSGKQIEVYQAGTATYSFGKVDPATQAVITIDYEHHEIHDGSMFRAGNMQALANDGSYTVYMKTPNTTSWPHLLYEISSTMELEFQFYEGAAVGTIGTVVPSYNRNRNSTGTAAMLVYHTPTTSNDGTLIVQRREGAGRQAGGHPRGESEFILKQNTNYLLRIYSRAGAGTTNYVNWWLVWYEHTDKVATT